MTTENILKEISDAIKLNNESKVTTNEALCHAGNVIRTMEKKLKAEYERGTKDAWDLARKITCYTANGGMSKDQLEMIFGHEDSSHIMGHYFYEGAKKVLDEYEAKKEKEIEKYNGLVMGDVVEVHKLPVLSECDFKAIFCGSDNECYYVLTNKNACFCKLNKDEYLLYKTDKHVDLSL